MERRSNRPRIAAHLGAGYWLPDAGAVLLPVIATAPHFTGGGLPEQSVIPAFGQ